MRVCALLHAIIGDETVYCSIQKGIDEHMKATHISG